MTEKEKLKKSLDSNLTRYGELEMNQDELTEILRRTFEEIKDSELKLWRQLLSVVDGITRYGYSSVPADEALVELLRALEY